MTKPRDRASAKVHVCFLVGGREGGGMAYSTFELIRRIDRDRFELAVVSTGSGDFVDRLEKAGIACEILDTGWPPRREPVRLNPLKAGISWARLALWVLRSAMALRRRLRGRRVDVIHANYYHFFGVAGLVARLIGCVAIWHWRAPLRSTARAIHKIAEGETALRAPKPLWPHLARFAVSCLGGGVYSIANSEATARTVRPTVGRRLSVIYNGIAIPSAVERSGRLYDLLKLPHGTRIIGMVGSLHPIKGHITFLDAVAQLVRSRSNLHFVHVGGHTAVTRSAYADRLSQRARSNGIEHRVHFLGNRTDAADLLRDFDVLCMCTLPPGEGFGLVVVEAMARAVPVISTNVGAAPEIVKDRETGLLVPPCDVPGLARAIEEILDDSALRARLVSNARRAVINTFDIDATVQRIERLYETLTTGSVEAT